MHQKHMSSFPTDGLVAVGPCNALLHALTHDLHTRGVSDPLHCRLSLVTLWRRLCRLGGEAIPRELALFLSAGLPLPPLAGGPITELLAGFLVELRAEGVALAGHHPLMVGLLWADLCRIAGEEPPAAVQALLDEPACAGGSAGAPG